MTLLPFDRVASIPPGARADLLSVVAPPQNIRADVIRQFHERHLLAEVLMDLEADEELRIEVVGGCPDFR